MASPNAWKYTVLTASGQVGGQGVEFGGISCRAQGTTTTATVYDGTSTSGTKILPVTGTLTTGLFVSPTSITATTGLPAEGLRCTTGLYVDIGGTGAPELLVYWR